MDTGSRPSPDGTTVFLNLASILDKALGWRKLRPIQNLLQNALPYPKKDYVLDLSRAFQSGESMTNQGDGMNSLA